MLELTERQLDMEGLVREDGSDFAVDPRVYTNPTIFEAEMRRIFWRTWVYVAHESEIPNAGDFRTGAVGQTPVLVTRDQDGAIHVLVNTCRHRGSIVCREERGNATFFQCPYHRWVYRNDGTLVQVPDVSGYPEGWRESIGGLLRAPRVARLHGMIFASFAEDGESFDAYLGPLKEYVDLWFGHSPVGKVRLLAPFRAHYPGNWKLQLENSTDGGHARFVHESAIHTMERFGTRSPAATWPGCSRGFDHGHGVLERPRDDIPPEVEPQFTEFRALLEEVHGPQQAERMFVRRHITIFPSFHLMEFKFRIIQPVAVDRTVVYEFPVHLEGIPDHINRAVFQRINREISISSGGPVSGFVNADDVEIFARVQSGLTGSPMDRVLFSRGLHRESRGPAGERVGESSDEVPQRAIYREWRRLMSAPHTEGLRNPQSAIRN
jgi:phenylpropionate dioxygenase-like ring-hydroxylating dioxygenase large terminal subunit